MQTVKIYMEGIPIVATISSVGMVMSALSLAPILIIFFFFQKQLVEGISTQGLKGCSNLEQ